MTVVAGVSLQSCSFWGRTSALLVLTCFSCWHVIPQETFGRPLLHRMGFSVQPTRQCKQSQKVARGIVRLMSFLFMLGCWKGGIYSRHAGKLLAAVWGVWQTCFAGQADLASAVNRVLKAVAGTSVFSWKGMDDSVSFLSHVCPGEVSARGSRDIPVSPLIDIGVVGLLRPYWNWSIMDVTVSYMWAEPLMHAPKWFLFQAFTCRAWQQGIITYHHLFWNL